MNSDRLYTEENFQTWAKRTRKLDVEFARKLMRDRPDLRMKELLDGRREEMRWAITVTSAARLLGVNVKTLRKILEDPYLIHLETIKPLASGHAYLWLEDVLEFSKRMTEKHADK